MKFLCVRCDSAMKLEQVDRPEGSSLSVVFACAACGNRVAMLTNPGETQLLRALDVRIGGRSSPVEPMEFVRSMLAPEGEAGLGAPGPSATAGGAAHTSGCPFSAMVDLAAEQADSQATGIHGSTVRRFDGSAELPNSRTAEQPNDPVAEAPSSRISWSPEAERRLERIPEFIRPMARQGIEHFAAARGYPCITERVMDEARGALNM